MSDVAPILELEGVAFGYGRGARPVLQDVSFSVPRGGFIALVGPSGVGKSSLLRVIAGLAPVSRGMVHLRSEVGASRRPTALVFQDARPLPWRRVLGNVEFGLEGLPLSRAERRHRAWSALSLVGLADHAQKWPHQLSGGQRQRVGIARALAVQPDLLLVDEPFGALDAITRNLLQDELLRIWHDTASSVIFVTHDLNEAVYLADRVIMLGGGEPAHVIDELAVDVARPRRRDMRELVVRADRLRTTMGEHFVGGSGI